MILIIFVMIIEKFYLLKNSTFYIGEHYATNEALSLTAFPDMIFNSTIISSNHFNCTEEYMCEI